MRWWRAVCWIIVGAILLVGFWGKWQRYSVADVVNPLGLPDSRPLDRYAIEALSTRVAQGSAIMLDQAIATTSAYTAYHFHFASEGKKVTGLAHIPQGPPAQTFPVIVQFRGYVDREKYFTGEGTQRSGEVYAANGFITLAPDFLGYGGSDMPASDLFEERLQTYTTALDLLASVGTLPSADATRVGIWGHSNGGHIALTVLEVLGQPIPATLWAPVSKPFPYSILYYTDEATDKGKYLRRQLAKFEATYDVDRYSLSEYLDRLGGPILLHQGTADTAVPIAWSDDFAKQLRTLHKEITYDTYPGADHNMLGAWNSVVARDVQFFQQHLTR